MRLIFGLGLMMLDQIIMPVRPLDYDRPVAVKGLFSSLTSVAKELAAIDRIDQGYWADATRHLAIRRGAWLSSRQPEPSPLAAVAFADGTEPMFEDFVADLRGDVRELFALIEVALRNHVDQNMLKQAIERSGLDLSKEYILAQELIALDPRRAGITAEQLSTAKTLLG